jgi:hypothetical protein
MVLSQEVDVRCVSKGFGLGGEGKDLGERGEDCQKPNIRNFACTIH